MATEYKIENRNLYIYLDGELDHHLAKKIKYQCDIILKSYPIKDIEFDFTNCVHMSSLRRKLRAVLGYDPILNKVGEGYQIREEIGRASCRERVCKQV